MIIISFSLKILFENYCNKSILFLDLDGNFAYHSSIEQLGAYMRNSSIYRSNLSNEKIAFLSEMKDKKELTRDDSTPKTYKRQRDKELDMLWQDFKPNAKEEKSPGVYLLTGFIAGALCVFVLNSILSINSNPSSEETISSLMGQPRFEKKISRMDKMPQLAQAVKTERPAAPDAAVNAAEAAVSESIPANETYTVKSGDSMSTIVYKFYGKYDPSKVDKIKQVNNLTSAHRLSIGQKLIIPLD